MKVAYITVKAPYGKGEAFVVTEMLEVLEQGVDLVVIPLRPEGRAYHGEVMDEISHRPIRLPLLSGKIIQEFLKAIMVNPASVVLAISSVVRYSRAGVLLKNLAVIPKGVYLARLLSEMEVKHIHAHWASTPSTCAYIASRLSGILWSFTAHRWDIAENNMLKMKVQSASFVRAISEEGRQEMLKIVGKNWAEKVIVIHMGVSLSRVLAQRERKARHIPTIVCIANLVEIKGHKYLIEACRILKDKGLRFRCLLVGDGLERQAIAEQIRTLHIKNQIEMRGALTHGEVQQLLQEEADIVVLPSIVTDKGEKEGIPVALMEAMSYAVPVVSTTTGGIPELLSNGAGIMVEEKASEELAKALEQLIQDEDHARKIGQRGYCKVAEEFNLKKNVKRLLEIMKGTVTGK